MFDEIKNGEMIVVTAGDGTGKSRYMKAQHMKLIEIDARWNDTQARFSAYAMIGTWDGTDDDNIFYYFDDENIIGNHGDFTVLNFVELETL